VARRSQFEHLKETILSLFSEGKKVPDVLKLYPDVPRKTLYDWFNEFHTKSTQRVVTLVNTSGNEYGRDSTPPNVVVQFRDENENDVRWLKRKLKEIIRCEDSDSEVVKLKAVRVQAINSYLQVIKHEASVPAVSTVEEPEWQDAIANYEELDEEDLAVRIKERLRKA
jgi:hypothetical protein